ncbi:hypothetical protein NECAME_08663 [Necator americanus]|uniref:Uncharacterized protein n=1 Tax=Necator americanus TaxID=51031 RepID=W2THC4_NECAM|nr:hypothetical protein NECAME_08663 [Necator americanus]ETN81223.1 hypothetical protein NECAME_08663 [Necator americanus]
MYLKDAFSIIERYRRKIGSHRTTSRLRGMKIATCDYKRKRASPENLEGLLPTRKRKDQAESSKI